MKKKLPKSVVFVCLILYAFCAIAQKGTQKINPDTYDSLLCKDINIDKHTILIDALTQRRSDIPCPACIKIGECPKIIIINANPLLYKVSVNTEVRFDPQGTSENFLDKLLKKLEKEDEAVNSPVDVAQKDIKSIPRDSSNTTISNYNLLLKKNEIAFEIYDTLVAFVQLLKKADDILHSNNRKQEEILQSVDLLFKSILQQIPEGAGYRDTLPFAIERRGSDLIGNFRIAAATVKEAYKVFYDAITSLQNQKNSLDAPLIRLKEKAKEIFDAINSKLEVVDNDFENGIATFIRNYRTVLPLCAFTYVEQLQCPDADSLLATVKIEPTTQPAARPAREYQFVYKIRGGFRTFSSTNIMFSFGSARDQSGYFNPIDSILKVTNGNGNSVPSLAIAQNFYWNNCTYLRYGFSFGVSANFAELSSLQDVRFFLGPSIIIGNKARFIATAGFTAGWVDRLKGRLNVGDRVTPALLSAIDNNLTEKVFKLGGFTFGVGYKIF